MFVRGWDICVAESMATVFIYLVYWYREKPHLGDDPDHCLWTERPKINIWIARAAQKKKTHGQIYDFSIKMRAILFITLAKDTDIEFIATPFRANKDLDNLIQKKSVPQPPVV